MTKNTPSDAPGSVLRGFLALGNDFISPTKKDTEFALHLRQRAAVLPCPSDNAVHLFLVTLNALALQPLQIIQVNPERDRLLRRPPVAQMSARKIIDFGNVRKVYVLAEFLNSLNCKTACTILHNAFPPLPLRFGQR